MSDAFRRPTPDPATVQEALRAIGHAVWELQSLEETLASYLVMRHDLVPDCTKTAFEEAMERRRKLTFGQLLRQREFNESLPASVIERLDALKGERNWLIHGSRRTLHVSLYTSATGAATITRLEEFAEAVAVLRSEVMSPLLTYLESHGRKPQPATVNAILEHWAKGIRHPGEVGET